MSRVPTWSLLFRKPRGFVNAEFFGEWLWLKGNKDRARSAPDHRGSQDLRLLEATSSMMAEIFSDRT